MDKTVIFAVWIDSGAVLHSRVSSSGSTICFATQSGSICCAEKWSIFAGSILCCRIMALIGWSYENSNKGMKSGLRICNVIKESNDLCDYIYLTTRGTPALKCWCTKLCVANMLKTAEICVQLYKTFIDVSKKKCILILFFSPSFL